MGQAEIKEDGVTLDRLECHTLLNMLEQVSIQGVDNRRVVAAVESKLTQFVQTPAPKNPKDTGRPPAPAPAGSGAAGPGTRR